MNTPEQTYLWPGFSSNETPTPVERSDGRVELFAGSPQIGIPFQLADRSAEDLPPPEGSTVLISRPFDGLF